MTIVITCLMCVAAYLIGSLPTGYLIAKYAGIRDIRAHGSGNIGATNVARILGWRYFLPVFLLDAVKAYGFLYYLGQQGVDEWPMILAALLLLIGNSCSLFLGFTGGKGFATTVGIVLMLNPALLFVLGSVWAFVFYGVREVGIASVAALLVLLPGAYYATTSPAMAFLMVFMSLWGVVRHRDNIERYAATFAQ